jgi:hypothetical protein
MWIQDVFTLVLMLLPLTGWTDDFSSASNGESRCFNFSAPITQVLHPERISKVPAVSGKIKSKDNDDLFWATVQGDVPASVKMLYTFLSDRNSTKSSRVDKMKVATEQDPQYLLKQKTEYEVDPFPFVTVKWTEEWGFSLLKGTPANPLQVLVSYEKIEGTSHIKHLCGNILLKSDSEGGTHVLLYEEAQATGRSQEDTLNGLKGTLKQLRDHAK